MPDLLLDVDPEVIVEVPPVGWATAPPGGRGVARLSDVTVPLV